MAILDPCSTYTTKSNYSTLLDLVFSPSVLFYGLIEMVIEAWNIWLDGYCKQRFGNLNHIVMFVYNESLVNLQKYSLNKDYCLWNRCVASTIFQLFYMSRSDGLLALETFFYCSVIRLFKRLRSLQYMGLFRILILWVPSVNLTTIPLVVVV